jgi:hypothetical protein
MKLRSIPAIGVLALSLAACSITTDTNEVGLDYDYDSWSGSKTLDQCVPPGSRSMQDINDPGVIYPADQRSFDFSGGKNADSAPIDVVSKDNLTMTVSGVATFYLNQDCKVLQQFHEKIGQKFAADTDEGWDRLLNVYVKQPLDRAMDAAAKKYDWKQLYADPAIKQTWETEVADLASTFIEEQSGGKFFTQFRFTLQQPQPPEGVRNALSAAQQALEENAAQKNKNEQALTELDLVKKYAEVLGPEGAILWQAVKDGSIQIVPVPEKASINIPAK